MPSQSARKLIIYALLALLVTILNFQFNRAAFRDGELKASASNIIARSEDYFQETFELHADNFPFSARLAGNAPISFLHNTFGLSLRHSFVIAQYGFLFLFFLVGYFYAMALFESLGFSILYLLLISISYPILFVHYKPMWTWDDIPMYIAATLALAAMYRRKDILFCLMVCLGLFARETILLLIPFYFLFSNKGYGLRFVVSVIPIVLYIAYLGTVPGSSLSQPITKEMTYDFQSMERFLEGLVYVLLGLGMPFFASLYPYLQLRKKAHIERDKIQRFFFLGFSTLLPLFLIMNVLASRMREIRVSFPILLITVPMAIYCLRGLRNFAFVNIYDRSILGLTTLGILSTVSVASLLTNRVRILQNASYFTANFTVKYYYLAFQIVLICLFYLVLSFAQQRES